MPLDFKLLNPSVAIQNSFAFVDTIPDLGISGFKCREDHHTVKYAIKLCCCGKKACMSVVLLGTEIKFTKRTLVLNTALLYTSKKRLSTAMFL